MSVIEKERLVRYKMLCFVCFCVSVFLLYSYISTPGINNFVPQRVAHGGGAFLGLTVTNSLESLDHNYRQGFRFFEIDLSFTRDNQLVCIHSWEGKKAIASWFGRVPNKGELLQAFEGSAFVPCTLESLMGWLSLNSEAVLITDIKQREQEVLDLIADQFPFLLDRIIPQIYQPESFADVRAIGYQRVIWTLYRFKGNNREVISHVKNFTQPFALTFNINRVNTGLVGLLTNMDKNIVTYVHTINDEVSVCMLKNKLNVSEVYTDTLPPSVGC